MAQPSKASNTGKAEPARASRAPKGANREVARQLFVIVKANVGHV